MTDTIATFTIDIAEREILGRDRRDAEWRWSARKRVLAGGGAASGDRQAVH